MGDNLGIRLKDRPPDATSKVAANASIWDTVTDLIENAIEELTRQGYFEGLLSSPGFSRTNMVVSFNAFQCVTQDGIYCELASGDVTHDAADPTNPRIDIICVDPAVQTSAGEITGSGEVKITKGTAAANPTVPDTPSGYLKVLEVDVPATATEVTLRTWKPMYIPLVMFRPFEQDTPDMTVKVNFGRGYISGNTLIDKGVQNSPTFTAPAANKCAIDILHIDSSGTLAITQGTEVDLPNEPSAPTYPTDKMVICEVYLEAGDTAIYQWQIKDVRPVLNLGVGLKNVVEDTTPELGGDLDAKTKRIYDIKWLDLKAPTELTIDTGAITITQSFHTVDTEEEAGSDELVTINGGSVGRVLILKPESDARTVVVKHGTGNIWLKGKEDLDLDDLEDGLILVYTAGSKWTDLGAPGGATTLLALTDFPDAYTDKAGQYCRVKATEDGLEFATPAGAGDMLKATYDVDEDDIVDEVKGLNLATASELTIADGAITVTQSVHTVDTQGDAGTDDLDTINGGTTVQLIILRAENDAHTVVVKHNTGNIWLKRKQDLSLDDLEDGLMLFWDGTKWIDVGAWDEATIGFSFAIPIDKPETEAGELAMGGAVADDGGTQTDETTAANNATENDMTLLPAAPAVNDAYYFGYATKVFNKLKVNIGTQGAGVWTITWEYYNGSSWSALSNVTDGCDHFRAAAGNHEVTFDVPSDWAKTTIQTIEAYWIRARVSAYTSITTQPKGTQSWILGTELDKGVFHFAPGVAGTIEEVYIMAKTAPGTDKTLTVDVNKGGVTIFTTQANRPSLTDANKTATSGTPDVTTFAKNDLFTVDVDVSTAETAVADVILFIRGKQKVA